MSSPAPYVVAALAVLFAAAGLVRRGSRARRRARALTLAGELVPEIRSILASADPHGASGGRPTEATVYEKRRDEIETSLNAEARFAVHLFYRSVEAYDEARRGMEEAFGEESGVSLGDRIRAKDWRDRCLKDVYLTGEAATSKLAAVD